MNKVTKKKVLIGVGVVIAAGAAAFFFIPAVREKVTYYFHVAKDTVTGWFSKK